MNHRKKVKSAGITLLIVSILGILCGIFVYGLGQFASYGAKKVAEKVTDEKYEKITEKLNDPTFYENPKFKEMMGELSEFEKKSVKEILKPETFLGIIDGLKLIHKHKAWHQLSLNYNFLAALVIGILLCLIARSWIKVKPFDPSSIRYWKILGIFLLLSNIPSILIDGVFYPELANPLNESIIAFSIFLIPACSQTFVLGAITLGIICLTISLILENGRQAMEEQEHTV